MVEEFDLLEEVEVQFCDEECTESVWHGVNYSERYQKKVNVLILEKYGTE